MIDATLSVPGQEGVQLFPCQPSSNDAAVLSHPERRTATRKKEGGLIVGSLKINQISDIRMKSKVPNHGLFVSYNKWTAASFLHFLLPPSQP